MYTEVVLWDVRVVNTFSVFSPEGVEVQTRSASSKELVFLLALAGREGISRRALIAAFDPGEGDPDGHFAVLLTRTRAKLKKYSSKELIASHGDRLVLEPANVQVDAWHVVEELENLQNLPGGEITQRIRQCASRFAANGLHGFRETGLLHDLRQAFCERVLHDIVQPSRDVQNSEQRSSLIQILHCIQPWLSARADITELVVSITASLGLKEGVLSAYMAYEDNLDNEFGEAPSHQIRDLVEELLREMEMPRTRNLPTPKDPTNEFFGRTNEVVQLITICSQPSSVFVHGPIGVGKTALLAKVFYDPQLASKKRLWLDCEELDEVTLKETLRAFDPDVIFLDHYSHRYADLAQRLVAQPRVCVVIAGQTRSALRTTYGLALRPLPVGTETSLREAVTLLQSAVSRHSAGSLAYSTRDYVALANACDGLPLALDLAARICAAIGVKAAIKRISRSPQALAISGAAKRHSSIIAAFVAGFESLPSDAAKLLAVLAPIDIELAIETVLDVTQSPTYSIVDLVDAGFVDVCQQNGSVRVSRFVRGCSEAVDALSDDNASFRAFIGEVKRRIMHADFPEPDACREDLGLVAKIVADEFQSGSLNDALDMLRLTKDVLAEPQHRLITFNLDHCLSKVKGRPIDEIEPFIEAMGRNLFYRRQVEDITSMHEFFSRDEGASNVFSGSPPLLMQLGLAHRMTGRLDLAEAFLRRAVQTAEQAPGRLHLSKAYANLAMLVDNVGGRSEEALSLLNSAIESMDSGVTAAPRIDYLHMRAMLHAKIYGYDHSSISDLEFALALAVEFRQTEKAAHILQNIGLHLAKQGLPMKSLAYELTGTSLLIRCGYGTEIQRLCFSSFGTIGAMLLEVGEAELASLCKVLIDRHDEIAVYEESAFFMGVVQDMTFDGTAILRAFGPRLEEVESLIQHCIKTLGRNGTFANEIHRIAKMTKLELAGAYLAEERASDPKLLENRVRAAAIVDR